MATFKSASLKIQFSLGMKDGKEVTRTKVYNNISHEATEKQLSDVKDLIAGISSYLVNTSEFVTTKSL